MTTASPRVGRWPKWLWLLALPLIVSCGGQEETNSVSSPKATDPNREWGSLVDRSHERRLEFLFSDDGSSDKRIYETMGGGVVLFDVEADGDLDVFFAGGGHAPATDDATTHQALFLNDGNAHFTEVTQAAGLADTDGAYAVGGAAGDVDGDGDLDLYVTAIGPNRLYLNDGTGRFSKSPDHRADGHEWTSTALLFDADGDQDLDLYLVNYVIYDPQEELPCTQGGLRVYCTPILFEAASDRFFLNDGSGRFSEASEGAAPLGPAGKGLAASASDFDDDGDLDIYVANDSTANFLWINDGQGQFSEEGIVLGAALGGNGREEASMGVAAADLDGDLDLDLVSPNFTGEVFNLFRQETGGFFTEVGELQGLGASTALSLGFGVVAGDFDLDGHQDLAFANGHINDLIEEISENEKFLQPNLLLRGVGGRFERWREREGDFAAANLARGMAAGDLDGDGDLDLVVSRIRQTSALFLAAGAPPQESWIALRPVLPSGAPALGTRAILSFENGDSLVAELTVGGSYASQSEPVLRFGLGGRVPASLSLHWPGGVQEKRPAPTPGQVLTIRQLTVEQLTVQLPPPP